MASFMSLQSSFYGLIPHADDILTISLTYWIFPLCLSQTIVTNYASMYQTFAFNKIFTEFYKVRNTTYNMICFVRISYDNVIMNTDNKLLMWM